MSTFIYNDNKFPYTLTVKMSLVFHYKKVWRVENVTVEYIIQIWLVITGAKSNEHVVNKNSMNVCFFCYIAAPSCFKSEALRCLLLQRTMFVASFTVVGDSLEIGNSCLWCYISASFCFKSQVNNSNNFRGITRNASVAVCIGGRWQQLSSLRLTPDFPAVFLLYPACNPNSATHLPF